MFDAVTDYIDSDKENIIKGLTIILLFLVTYFRREWSCNDNYRITDDPYHYHNHFKMKEVAMDSIKRKKEQLIQLTSEFNQFVKDDGKEHDENDNNEIEEEDDELEEEEEGREIGIFIKMEEECSKMVKKKLECKSKNTKVVKFKKDKLKQEHELLMELLAHDDLSGYFLPYVTAVELEVISQLSIELKNTMESEILWQRLFRLRYDHLFHNEKIRQILEEKRDFYEDPTSLDWEPKQGWKCFYLDFQYAWVDWLLAGLNTRNMCLVGIDGAIYDVTNFLDDHPGSPEVLLEYSGIDATQIFQDVNHSQIAHNHQEKMLVVKADNVSYTDATSFDTIFWNVLQYEGKDSHRLSGPHSHHERMAAQRRCIAYSIGDIAGQPSCDKTGAVFQRGKLVNVLKYTSNWVADLPGRRRCINDDNDFHRGNHRIFYDPFECKWLVWWSCCGLLYTVEMESVQEINANSGFLNSMSEQLKGAGESLESLQNGTSKSFEAMRNTFMEKISSLLK